MPSLSYTEDPLIIIKRLFTLECSTGLKSYSISINSPAKLFAMSRPSERLLCHPALPLQSLPLRKNFLRTAPILSLPLTLMLFYSIVDAKSLPTILITNSTNVNLVIKRKQKLSQIQECQESSYFAALSQKSAIKALTLATAVFPALRAAAMLSSSIGTAIATTTSSINLSVNVASTFPLTQEVLECLQAPAPSQPIEDPILGTSLTPSLSDSIYAYVVASLAGPAKQSKVRQNLAVAATNVTAATAAVETDAADRIEDPLSSRILY